MKKIGELLVENGIITQKELAAALEMQKSMDIRKPLGEIMVEMKIITIESLIKYLEIQLKEKFNNSDLNETVK